MIYLNGWVEFIKEDIVRSKSIISKKMEAYETIKDMLKKTPGYIGQFTEWIFSGNISVEDLRKTYQDLLYLKSKNKNLNINGLEYEECIDKIQIMIEDIDISKLINEFPKTQKDLIKGYLEKYKNQARLLLLKVLSKDNTVALLSKISRYKTEDDLIGALKSFSKDIKNTKEGLLDLLDKCKKSNMVYQKDDIIIVWVGTQEDIKILGSDTSWCIVSSKSMWNSYTSDLKRQFILYDFDEDDFSPDLKIGFTLNPKGYITAAHNILDKSKKDFLREKLDSYGINTNDLYNKTLDKLSEISDVSKLKSNMSISKFYEVGMSCKIEDIPKVLEKIPKRGDWELVYVKLLKRFFSDELITVGEIKKKLGELKVGDYTLRKNFLDEKYPVFYTNNQNIISKGLDIWSDNVIISSIKSSNIQLFDLPMKKSYSKQISKENLDKLFKRIQKIVNEYDLSNEESVSFWQMVIVLFAFYNVNLPEKYKEKYSLLTTYIKNSYNSILNLEAELDNNIDISSPNSVKNIIKKNYDNSFYIRKEMFSSGFMDELLNHLEGYNLVFKVNKNEIFRIESLNPENHNDKVKSLLKMCSRIKNLRTSEIEEGNIKLKKYSNR